ncbi:MAG TPA: nickel-dependent hydrogenase large subunit [Arenibaculum sp.]|nr:nickel-dependent hydrogenase large subunit [Arenibaculum sp.]
MTLEGFLAGLGPREPGHRPVPRHMLGREGWNALIERLRHDQGWSLVGEWAEVRAGVARVHLCLRDETGTGVGQGVGQGLAVASLSCPDGRFPSLSLVRPAAIRFERAIQDLFGLTAEALVDPRPWLDHDTWPVRAPLSLAPPPPLSPPPIYGFLPAEGEGLHQIPVGPVHAGIIEPGHFRFTCNGETVVRLEERLGYAHKGIEAAIQGRHLADAARLAARVSGDSTAAHGLAFARAVEAATGCRVPPRAVWLRALMAEIERVANHFGDIGAICNDAAFAFMLAECGALRELVLRATDRAFGHRLMMDAIVPGGVSIDPVASAMDALAALLPELTRRFADLVRTYDGKSSLQDRTVATGRVDGGLVRRFAAGGHVGRASGRGHDARRSPGYEPYGELAFDIPVFDEGDVNARVWVRIREVEQSLGLIGQILARLPGGPVHAGVPQVAGEGIAFVEAFRGEIMTWVSLDADGTVLRCHPRDASWLQWPLLEAAIDGNIVADFPLCNKSFNCSYSGHDL